jgi:DNA polymerase-3 subunit alpha
MEDVADGRGLQKHDDVTVAGVVADMTERPLKSGDGRMAFVTLEDRTGRVEVLVFSRQFAAYEEALKSGDPLLVRGDVMVEGDGDAKSRKVRADEIVRLIEARKDKVNWVNLELQEAEVTNGELDALREVLKGHPGDCRTRIGIEIDTEEGTGQARMALPEDFCVEPSNELLQAIDRVFGRPVVRLGRSR